MHRRLAGLDSGGFGGVVFDAGFGLPQLESIPAEILIRHVPVSPQQEEAITSVGFLLGRLMSVTPGNPQQKAELTRLTTLASDVGAALDSFVSDCRQTEQLTLKRQHAEIRKQGKAQTARLEQAEHEFTAANTAWNNAVLARQKSIEDVRTAQYYADHLGRWVSDNEIDAAASKLVSAQDKAAAAVEKEAFALASRNAAEERIFATKRILNITASEEIRLRAALNGEAYVDAETGLSSAPSGG